MKEMPDRAVAAVTLVLVAVRAVKVPAVVLAAVTLVEVLAEAVRAPAAVALAVLAAAKAVRVLAAAKVEPEARRGRRRILPARHRKVLQPNSRLSC